MRKCPKCGYEVHPMWRPRRSRVFCDYVKTETLNYNDPLLLRRIQSAEPEPYFDGHFVFHITKSRLNVEMIEKYLYDFMKWGSEPQEKVDHKLEPDITLKDFQSSRGKTNES